ncbi:MULTISPECIES: hypothetical protein [Anaerotruncus]|uniref:hypothetical protein n=2 Tax=Oscillospiraceae TaxID=216572 RepID=UPI00082CFC07|nr:MULTISPECIES: hypothetical protein [Anaerotruncus]RGX54595.1 hypothetical protein DWV16_13135 [Anaerotruncus sp. AF02-27]
MKLVQLIRYLFQVMVLVAVFCLIGSIGAWETGSINFPQLLLQLILFSGCALFASHLSHQRFFIRVRRRRPVRAVRPEPHPQSRRVAAAHSV